MSRKPRTFRGGARPAGLALCAAMTVVGPDAGVTFGW